jgi:protein gp37
MAENSSIEWTDHTFNPWRGCAKVHAGCAHCYAEREAKRFPKNRGIWGPQGTSVVAAESMWRQPLKWNETPILRCVECGKRFDCWCGCSRYAIDRARVFCASLADVFEDWQGPIVDHTGRQLWECANCGFYAPYDPVKPLCSQGLEDACSCSSSPDFVPLGMASVRKRLFGLIDATPNLDWLLVTKRPENILRMWPGCDVSAVPDKPLDTYHHYPQRSNVWLLTSVSDQESADKFVPELLKCRDLVPVLGLSIEPLLGPVNLSVGLHQIDARDNVDWVIVGGESGRNARPMHPDWARSIRDQCQAAGVPFFFKQWGKRNAGRLLDGREWNEYPTTADQRDN